MSQGNEGKVFYYHFSSPEGDAPVSVSASLLLVLLMCFGYGEIRLYAFSCYIRVSLLSAGQIHSLFDVSRDKYMDGRGIKKLYTKASSVHTKTLARKKLFSI